ncbi:MAG: ComEC/Rec2 family competence protein, partial [Malacoplasma sp.]|nr:ComEC/Rec2 family competence protein [Malacoplasma sp.]
MPLLIVILFWFYKRNSWKQILITSIIASIPVGLNFLIKDYNLFTHITPAIDNLLNFSIRNYLVSFVNSSYDTETGSIVNLLIFNIKQDIAKEVYQTMIDMSIVYLVVVGGMHLSFVQNILLRIVKKHKLPIIIFNNIFCFFYTYLLNFSISTSRVLLSNANGLLKLKWKLSPYDKCALAGVVSMFIYPNVINNIGFNLSYLCSLGIIFVYQFNIKNYFLRTLCINSLSFLISLPYVIQINKSISAFAIITSFFLYL